MVLLANGAAKGLRCQFAPLDIERPFGIIPGGRRRE
jgi:hypothetical protein